MYNVISNCTMSYQVMCTCVGDSEYYSSLQIFYLLYRTGPNTI